MEPRGQYLRGAASQYQGDQLARLGHVVVVTLDYRLGPLGFPAHPALTAESALGTSGNQALFDHLQALRWLRANVGRFGGDPDRLTLFGESAGSATARALLGSPLAAGLFHRAILESNACPGTEDSPLLAEREAFGRRLAQALGCEDAQAGRGPSPPSMATSSQRRRLGCCLAREGLATYQIDTYPMTADEALKSIQEAFHRGRYVLDPHVLRRMTERHVSFHDLKYAVLHARRATPYLDSGRQPVPGTTCWRLDSETMDGEATSVGVDLVIDHLGAHATVMTVF